jgi:molecular chaperone DnaK
MNELGDQVPASDRATIESTIEDLKRAKDSDDLDRIRQLTEQLQQASYAIGQQMYAQQGGPQPDMQGPDGYQSPGGNGSGPEPHGEPEGEEFVEGEFREV